ncbi:uncharacterized protein [Taeniopygia guttata]|uniref:uncharacterized protein isoform X22 n=1 Tax=Taeniopygia guttata TaxID=59729 RepID=UPI003BB99798
MGRGFGIPQYRGSPDRPQRAMVLLCVLLLSLLLSLLSLLSLLLSLRRRGDGRGPRLGALHLLHPQGALHLSRLARRHGPVLRLRLGGRGLSTWFGISSSFGVAPSPSSSLQTCWCRARWRPSVRRWSGTGGTGWGAPPVTWGRWCHRGAGTWHWEALALAGGGSGEQCGEHWHGLGGVLGPSFGCRVRSCVRSYVPMERLPWTPLRCPLQGSSGPSPAAWGSCCRFGGTAACACLTCCPCCGGYLSEAKGFLGVGGLYGVPVPRPCPTQDCGSCCGLSSTVTPLWRPRSSGISLGGLPVVAGTVLVPNLLAAQQDPDIWQHPEVFLPVLTLPGTPKTSGTPEAKSCPQPGLATLGTHHSHNPRTVSGDAGLADLHLPAPQSPSPERLRSGSGPQPCGTWQVSLGCAGRRVLLIGLATDDSKQEALWLAEGWCAWHRDFGWV